MSLRDYLSLTTNQITNRSLRSEITIMDILNRIVQTPMKLRCKARRECSTMEKEECVSNTSPCGYHYVRRLSHATSIVYIGDSAALSYLQTIRQLVSSVIGTTPFTIDPQRYKILETSIPTPPTYTHTFILPDKEAAFFLTDSFFTSVSYLPGLPVLFQWDFD